MYDCDSILQALSVHLDGAEGASDLSELRARAARAHCLELFEAMLEVHQRFAAAAMAEPPRDLAPGITRTLVWQHRRHQGLALAVLFLGLATTLIPTVWVIWAGIALYLDPGLVGQGLELLLQVVNLGTALLVALSTAAHLLSPIWITSFFTLVALVFLLMSLVLANQHHGRIVPAYSPLSSNGRFS